MSLKVAALSIEGEDKDGAHAHAAERLRDELPALRWVASYRTSGGPFDFVDVFEADDEEDEGGRARAVLDGLAGVRCEWMDAEASAVLRAPGGGAPGGAPGGG